MNIIDVGLKFKSNHSIRSGNPNGFVLHHAAASSASVETVHQWHLNKGWAGIGYHFYVRKDGKVYRGRPENWVGAHTSGHNSTKLGICAEGNFETEKMPEAQKNAIIELLAYLRGKYGNLKVYRHKDLDSTACPGKNYPFDEIVNGKVVEESKDDELLNFAMPLLYKGKAGNEVKTLQRLLYAMGYNLGTDPIDGDFGKNTDNAVKLYQKNNGLGVDGYVGNDTWNKLLKG